MNITFKILVYFSLFTLYACSSSPKVDDIPLYKPILVRGEVLEFKEKAYWSHYSDGSYESADLINFKILEPQNYKGKKITVHMVPFSVTKNELREGGNIFDFEIDSEIFKDESKSNSHTIYFLGQDNFHKISNEPTP